jgi:hypothetical protein
MEVHHEIGTPLGEAQTLISELAISTMKACLFRTHEYEVLESRRWEFGGKSCDVLVVDCINDQIPSQNAVGIMVRERLALIFFHKEKEMPQVRVLRKDFPQIIHLNVVDSGEPASLCLYDKPWASIRRSWTPEKFLQNILDWLEKSSKRQLHQADQPVEFVFPRSPFEIVVPPKLNEKIEKEGANFGVIPIGSKEHHKFRLNFTTNKDRTANGEWIPLCVKAEPLVHGKVEPFYTDLGGLLDALVCRDDSTLDKLRKVVCSTVGENGANKVPKQRCFLILSIPITRGVGTVIEKTEDYGFLLFCNLVDLGIRLGVLCNEARNSEEKYYAVKYLLGGEKWKEGAWREIRICPILIRSSNTIEFSRAASGIAESGANENYLLAGVGALGSNLADIWAREAWGLWTYVDPDFLQPHNTVRHIGKFENIGFFKVNIVKGMVEKNYYPQSYSTNAIPDELGSLDNVEIRTAINCASLIVDATTTLEVPRDLSRNEVVKRAVSVFLTPSGKSSVLMLEDYQRHIRLDALEAQYYSKIINDDDWGQSHLVKEHAELYVGSGCRDASFVISGELILLHASILARQIRLLSTEKSAFLRIWNADEASGSVALVDINVQPAVRYDSGSWVVVSNYGISDKMKSFRENELPCETGGIIVGYTDHVLKTIYVVDVLLAPSDSKATESSFVRGTEGLGEHIADIRKRTNDIVGYIGEWHSHPRRCGPPPSPDDFSLLEYCSIALRNEGEPALMMIVGDKGEISCTVRDST